MENRTFADLKLSRLMLGTVQFGLPYGVANRSGQPSLETIREILAYAYEHGVNCLDTAAGYGTSEEVLGCVLADLGIADRMVVATKVGHLAPDLSFARADALIEESVVASLKRLRRDVLPMCLLHSEDSFRYIDSLLNLQAKGLIRHVGISTVTPEATLAIVSSGRAEAIQVPASILDHRFTGSGICAQAAARRMAVFARSIYLQGLVLMNDEDTPADLVDVIPPRCRLRAVADAAGMSLAELAMRYILGLAEVTCILVGVESVAQVKQNIELFAKGPLDAELTTAIRAAVPNLPEHILCPYRWAKRMPDAQAKR